MVEVKVHAGICGFSTTIKTECEDMQNATIEFQTECPNLKPLEQELKEADAFEECFSKIGTSNIYELGRKYCKHAACPVPCAIMKAVEAGCGLALPKDVQIKITKV